MKIKLFANVQERKMSVWSAVISLLLGAVIHGNFALECYECRTFKGKFCDDPIDIKDRDIIEEYDPNECPLDDLCKVTCEDGDACASLSYLETGMQISYVTQR